MQENEFEKQVKQKMDEFHLRPSAPVWLEIRKQLINRRRRRLLLFIPMLALVLAGGYYTRLTFFTGKKISSANETNTINTERGNEINKLLPVPGNKNTNTTAVTAEEDKTVKEEKKNRPVMKEKREASKDSSFRIKKSITEGPAKGTQNPKSPVRSSDNSKSHLVQIKIKKALNSKVAHDHLAEKNKTDKAADNNKQSAVNSGSRKDDAFALKPGKVNNSIEDIALAYKMVPADNNPVVIDPDIEQNRMTDSLSPSLLTAINLPRFETKNSDPKKWKAGFTFAVGASSRANKPWQINSSEAEKSLPAALGMLSSSGGVVNGGVFVLPPSEVKAGVAFKAGIVVAKTISKRFDISSGLLYSYSSDHIQVGKSISSSAAASSYLNFDVRNQSSYTSIQNSDYTNKYHFIELPFSVSYNLTGKWRVPLVLNTGVSISRLISTNALLYDAAWGGIYYDGKEDINKTQVNISAGFSFRFGNKSGWQWNIGPKIYVSTTKLFTNAYDDNKHPLYGGLHMQVLLPSKKRSR